MNPDELKQIWRSQNCRGRVAIDPDLLLRQLQRSKKHFAATIFWRDVREVFVACVLVILFSWWAIRDREWTWGVVALATAFVAVFMLVDRFRQRRRCPPYSNALLACVEDALTEVNHQIWLLKNVFWWYLLPGAMGVTLIFARSVSKMQDFWDRFLIAPIMGSFFVLFFWGVYHLNQRAVRKELEPRRQELEAIFRDLTAGSGADCADTDDLA